MGELDPKRYAKLVNEIAKALTSDRWKDLDEDQREGYRGPARRIVSAVPDVRRIAEQPSAMANPDTIPTDPFPTDGLRKRQVWGNLDALPLPETPMIGVNGHVTVHGSNGADYTRIFVDETHDWLNGDRVRNLTTEDLRSVLVERDALVGRLRAQVEELSKANARLGRGQGHWADLHPQPVDEDVDNMIVTTEGENL